MPNNVHLDIQSDPERDTRKSCVNPGFGYGYGCNVEYFGQETGRTNGNVDLLYNINPAMSAGCINPGFGYGYGCNVAYIGQGTRWSNGNVDMLYNINPDIQREAEKQKIREEVVAAEMAGRRELETEMREELRIERELAFW